jgi:2-polyprenyl-3-methyl-5-hydroxy-6-metoxy-1,4-benzoquinol methylase
LNDQPYAREPIEVVDDIPVFSARDAYVENYDRIAQDHLAAIREQGLSNPFIEEQDWQDIERSTAELLKRHARPGWRVLDVGVGLGRLLERFPDLDRYGLDVSIDYLREARGRGINVCCARAEDMPYSGGFFDAIVCTDVLEHVIDLNKVLDLVTRVLKPDGLLIVRVPDAEDLSPYLAPDYPYALAHLRSFDEAALRLLLCRVYPFEFIVRSHAHLMTHAKTRVPSKAVSWLLMRILPLAALRNASLRRLLVRLFYRPIVINVVCRKTDRAAIT